MIHDDVLGTIHDAWLVRLPRLASGSDATLVAALAMPGTSLASADALALRCVADAERAGALEGASTLVAYGATFGASVAQQAAARGLASVVVVDDATSRDERNRIRVFGADLRVLPVRDDGDEPTSTAIAARRIASETPGALLVDKRRTLPGPVEERFGTALVGVLGPDLHAVVGADRDALPLAGVRGALAQRNASALVVTLAFDGVAWAGDAGGTPLLVSEHEALATARRVARDEGVLCGSGPGGAALAAALRLVADAPPGGVVVALVPAASRADLVSTYDASWWEENHGRDAERSLTAAAVLARKEHGPAEIVTLARDATVADAIRIMRDLEVSQIPVVDGERIVGTIREDQVIDLLLHAPERKDGPVDEVMEDPLPEIDEDASVEDLQSLLVRGGSAVIVRRRGGGREILTKYDLIHALARG